MDKFRGFGSSKSFRKQRTNLYRRPQNESQLLLDSHDMSSISSTPPSDSLSKASSCENVDYYGNSSRTSYNNPSEAETAVKQGVGDGNSGDFRCSDSEQKDSQIDMNRSNDGYLTSRIKDTKTSGTVLCSNHSGLSVVSDGAGNDRKFKKVKLKVGGVTRTIHTSSVAGSSSTKSSSSSAAPQPWQPKENTGGHHSSYTGKAIGLRGIPWKDFAQTGLSIGRVHSLQEQVSGQIAPLKQFGKYKASHKSKPVLKRHLSGERFNDEDDEDDDDEIRYLEKLRSSKYSTGYIAGYEDDELGSKKHRKISRVLSQTSCAYVAELSNHNSLKAGKGIKKFKSAREYHDTDYEEEAVLSDSELEPEKKIQCKEFIDISGDGMRKLAVTTRRRALQTGKHISSNAGLSAIEFPQGLPLPPPRKQKEQLSEVEQQLKKAEAAQRRRMQAEKAARESEAEAIRKILGQDSSRKKREDKLKKRQEELAQERTTTAAAISSNVIRWVMGPSGTVVTFPNELGLPSIFEPKACSYPPPREKCAGPSCMNAYKYRDSKSKLPLCSLQCYKAIHEKIQPLSAC